MDQGIGKVIGSENPVTAARNRVAEATARIRKVRQSVETVADITFGAEPEAEGRGAAQPPRCGEAGLLHDHIDSLNDAINDLELQVGRLSPLSFAEPKPSVAVERGPRNDMYDESPIRGHRWA